MIGAAEEFARIAIPVDCDLGALVRTPVEEHVDFAIGMPNLNNGLITDLRGEVVTFLRRLAFMADKHPGIREQVFHFQPVDIRAGVNVSVDLRPGKQGGDIANCPHAGFSSGMRLTSGA